MGVLKIKSQIRKKQRRKFISTLIILLIFALFVSLFRDKLYSIIAYNPINADTIAESQALEDTEELEDNHIIEQNNDLLKDTVYTDSEGNSIVKNPDDVLVLVNKERNLQSDYKPEDLVIPKVNFSFDGNSEKKYLRNEAAKALEELFSEGEKQGIILYAVSGFRSYSTQERIFNNKVNKVGIEAANKVVAYPGQSEHQTGLAMDVSSKSAGFSLEENFGQTVEGKWLKDNAHRFGFIIRYPKDKVDITKYNYEPWHLRYVGIEAASEIYEKQISLEEYLGFKNTNSPDA